MINCTQMLNLDNVEKHIQNLESLISYSKSCDDEYVEPEDSNDLTSFVENEGKTYRDKSPFGKHFDTIYEKCKSEILLLNEKPCLEAYPCYNPKLLNIYLPIIWL